jgi:hypothetical protein
MRHLSSIVMGVSVAMWAQSGLAFFDAEVFYGSRTSSVKYTDANGASATKNLQGTDIGANFLLDPIPLVPVAFGVTAIQGSTNYDDLSNLSAQSLLSDPTFANGNASGKGSSKTMLFGPMIKVWVPVPKVKPYLKAAYILGGEILSEEMNVSTAADAAIAVNANIEPKTVFTHRGTEITLGLGFSPLKFTSIFAEYTIHSGKRSAKSMSGTSSITAAGVTTETPFTSADLSDSDKKEIDANSKSIRFGLSVGL